MAEAGQQPVTSGKRVAKNTLFLYIRMFIVMGVTIFTSRVILQSLGEVDYGVMNVVGGIAFSFGFFSSSMTNATQRYLSFGHGKGDISKVKEFFNLISTLYIIACGIILVVGGSLGFWIVSKLNIPPESYWPGVVVYYTVLVGMVITLFSTTFDSALIAREKMGFYAYMSIVETILKLGLAYLIFILPTDKLIYYAIIQLLITIIVKGTMAIYCMRKYPECEVKFVWQPKKMKGVLSFMGWNGAGTIVYVLNEQGINILINLFFGPILNAARGIANQVNSAIGSFSNNFFLALNPQIIKSYAAGELDKTIKLMKQSSIFSFYLMWIIILPLILRRDYVLGLWLKEVPEYTSTFLLWILIYRLINILSQPQWTVMQAVGSIRQYIINGMISMVGAVPIGYLFFRLGYPPQSIFIVMAVLRAIYVIVSTFTIHKYIKFSLIKYSTSVFLPLILMTGVTFVILYTINLYIPENFIGLIIVCLSSIILVGSTAMIAIGKSGRKQIFTKIKGKLIQFHN